MSQKSPDVARRQNTSRTRMRSVLPAILGLVMCPLVLRSAPAIDDDHRVQFHAQGGTLNDVGKDDTEVVKVSQEPITKAEAIAALDDLVEKLKKLRNHPKVTKADLEAAIELIPQMKDWVNRAGPDGIKTGISQSVKKGDIIRVDCEPIRGWVLVDNLPHSFQLTASGWDKTSTQSWKDEDCPGRKVGRKEFDELKAKMFKEWELDPSKTNDLKVRVALAAWKDAREWFENVVLRQGVIEGDDKSKTIDKDEVEAGTREKIKFQIEVRVLNGIAFVEEE